MDTTTIQAEALPAYTLRGLGLYELHSEEILSAYRPGGHWLVPSGTVEGRYYEVRTGGSPEDPNRGRCECVGFQHHGHCSHHVAAARVAKKSAVCDSCGKRCWNRELLEVQDDDGLLSWFPGDRICRECIRAGAWV